MRVPATRAILYEFGQLKMGVILIKWAWPKKIFARASRALLLQPHHCNNLRSAPGHIPVIHTDRIIHQHTSF